MSKFPRDLVYVALNEERDYQDSLPDNRTNGAPKSVGEYITMLQNYQYDLVRAWTVKAGDAAALDVMRKIAGIAVHCMEDHGIVFRKEG